MRGTAILTNQQISDAYDEYSQSLYIYIMCKVNDEDLAKDMMHDTFLKLLEHRGEVRIDTVKSLLYVIARNIIIDYVRRQEKSREIFSDYYRFYDESYNSVESDVNTKEISSQEIMVLKTLPEKRRKVYALSRFREMTVKEISECLNLSFRTVENHLFISRKEVREHIRKCI